MPFKSKKVELTLKQRTIALVTTHHYDKAVIHYNVLLPRVRAKNDVSEEIHIQSVVQQWVEFQVV